MSPVGPAVFVLFVILAGCVPVPDPDPVPMPDRCGAAALQYLVGSPASVLEGMRFSQPLRVIPPGAAITMDHNPGRLNVNLSEDGLIQHLWCG